MSSARALAIACVAVLAPSSRARAADRSLVDALRDAIHARIDAAIIAKPPALKPPKAVKRAWKLTKIGTLDVGAPLAALAAGDADGDGIAELYAVTARELIAIAFVKGKPTITGRVAFAGDATPVPPRDVVASVVIERSAIVAAASPWQHGLRATWAKGVLVATPTEPGFPQCPGESAPLAPGRNYIGDATTGTYATRCGAVSVDTAGYPLQTRATLSVANKLTVDVARCAAVGLGCTPSAHAEHASIGTAFDVADVDHDGALELISSAASPPGDADALRIVELGAPDKATPKLRKAFAAGGVAGVAVGDVDGDGALDVLAAVRVVGAPRVDLWRLE